MNIKSYFAFILISLVIKVYAQDTLQSVNTGFIESNFDFGYLNEEIGKASHDFIFVNTTSDTILFKEIDSDCGCTTSKIKDKSVAPQDSSSISIIYDATDRLGAFKKNIKVITSSKTYTLSIEGVVIPAVRDVDREFPYDYENLRLRTKSFHMGFLPRDSITTKRFLIYNASSDTVILSSTELKDKKKTPAFTLQKDTLPPQMFKQFDLVYTAKAKINYGYRITDLDINVEKMDSTIHSVAIPVRSTVIQSFDKTSDSKIGIATVDTLLKTYGVISESDTLKTTFSISNIGDGNLTIESIQPNCACVEASVKKKNIAPGKSSTIDVTFLPKDRRGTQRKSIHVYTNSPETPVVILKLEGKVRN